MLEAANREELEISQGPQRGDAKPSPILVLGLGNEILKDDAVGVLVAEKLRGAFRKDVEVRSTSLFGLSLLDELLGREKVLLIDSYLPGNSAQGEFLETSLDWISSTQAACPHCVGLAEIREVMCSLNFDFPREVHILAIPVLDPLTFSTEMSPEVVARLDEAVERARRIVENWS